MIEEWFQVHIASSFKLLYCEEQRGAMFDGIFCMFVHSAKLAASSDSLLIILLLQKTTKIQVRIRIENVMTHVAIVWFVVHKKQSQLGRFLGRLLKVLSLLLEPVVSSLFTQNFSNFRQYFEL